MLNIEYATEESQSREEYATPNPGTGAHLSESQTQHEQARLPESSHW